MKCSVDNCENEAVRKKACLCEKHYTRLRRWGSTNYAAKAANGSLTTCTIPGCERKEYGRGLCGMHYQRLARLGYVGEVTPRHNQDGTGTINNHGYRIMSINGEKQKEHRLIAEKALGKKLPPGAVVHHLNGDRLDNRPCNLVICPDEAYHKLLHKRQKELGYKGPSL